MACSVVVGMLLRRVTGQGTALSFVLVAQAALDGFIKSRRVDFTRFGDLVRFPLRAALRRKV